MGDLTIFAQRMKQSRERLGLKQKDLAERVSVTPQTISAYEKADVGGKGKNPTLENAVEIAKALNVSLDWLCGMENRQPEIGRERTLGDFARMIVEMLTWGTIYFTNIEEEVVVDVDLTIPTKNPAIVLQQGEMRKFLEDFRKMRSLLIGETIDQSLYDRWLQDRIAALDHISCETQHSFSTEEFLEDDKPLPF